jgi:hypothetical protein
MPRKEAGSRVMPGARREVRIVDFNPPALKQYRDYYGHSDHDYGHDDFKAMFSRNDDPWPSRFSIRTTTTEGAIASRATACAATLANLLCKSSAERPKRF